METSSLSLDGRAAPGPRSPSACLRKASQSGGRRRAGRQALLLSSATILFLATSGDLLAQSRPSGSQSGAEASRQGIQGVVRFSSGNTHERDNGRHDALTAGVYLVDVTINETGLPVIAEVEVLPDKRVALPESVWTAARLQRRGAEEVELSDGGAGYVLDSINGLEYWLDPSRQTLRITAPAGAFLPARFELRDNHTPPPEKSPLGAYINYDLTATTIDDGSTTYGGNLNVTIFNGSSAVVAGALIRGSNRGDGFQAIRMETFWQKDLPDNLTTIVLGDTIGSDSGWSRPVRYGGVRFGRSFDLDPSFITYPLPSIEGSAALPSTVDILVNDRLRQRDVKFAPGPFSIQDVPVVTGAGQINLIVRNLQGTETVLTRDYYFLPDLLAPGVSDFSFEAGWMRRSFGRLSNDYGPAFAAATWRQGITRTLTLEGRVEMQRRRQAAGIAANATIGNLLSVRVAAAYANTRAGSGGRYLVAAEHSGRNFGISAQWEYFDLGFEQFGSSISERRPKERLQLGGSTRLLSWLSLGGSYIRETTWDGDRFRIAATNLTARLPGNFHLSAFASDNLSRGKGWMAGLALTRSLGSGRSASASLTRGGSGQVSKHLTAGQATPAGPGFGWRVQARDNGGQSLQAGATLNTSKVQLNGDFYLREGGRTAIRASARGSIGLVKGLPFASRPIDGQSFAVVNVGNLPGVRVFRSNQYAATTNRKGLALVTGLLPFQPNKLSVQADEIPFNVDIGGTEEIAVPYARSGIFVDFPIRRSLNALLTLRTPDGNPVPLGARIAVANGGDFIVGKQGKAYLTDLGPENAATVSWPDASCTVTFTLDPEATDEARLDPVICGDTP